jgi:hypothetical protein
MNSFKNNNDEKRLDDLLGKSIGSEKVEPDFEKWRQNHPQAVEMLISRANRQYSASICPLGIWRTIMKSSITKLAAAAVIIIAAVLSVNFLAKSTTSAYALEQTIQASHSIRHIHVRNSVASHDEPMEFWLEFEPSGQLKNMRLHKPAWMEPDDGATILVWKDNKAQLWIKKKNFLVALREDQIAEQVLKRAEELDPKFAVERLQKKQEEGKIELTIKEPTDKTEPIIITATSLKKDDDSPFQRMVLFVDQATRLVNIVEFYNLENGEYHKAMTSEYFDYNQPIDAAMFAFNDIPDNVVRWDQTTQETGLLQGNLTDEEIAVKVVREFLEALIARDFAKAGKLLEGIPADKMQQAYGKVKYLRIISIGQPTSPQISGMGGFRVPCKIEIEKDGKVSEWQPFGPFVRQVHGQPERWTICGGF